MKFDPGDRFTTTHNLAFHQADISHAGATLDELKEYANIARGMGEEGWCRREERAGADAALVFRYFAQAAHHRRGRLSHPGNRPRQFVVPGYLRTLRNTAGHCDLGQTSEVFYPLRGVLHFYLHLTGMNMNVSADNPR